MSSVPQLDLDALARECGVSTLDVTRAIRVGVAVGLLRVVDDGDPDHVLLEALLPDAGVSETGARA